jgi:hypothetical protein
MTSLNLDLDFFDHPKTRRLVGLLGRGSEVLPIKLWCWCAKYHAESGWLTGYSAQEIESILGWWGEPGKMVEAMVKVGFLIESVDGLCLVRDLYRFKEKRSVLLLRSLRSEYRNMRAQLLKALRRKYEPICYYCGSPDSLTIDHKIPLSRGGSNSLSNLVFACASCNFRKRTKLPEEFQNGVA